MKIDLHIHSSASDGSFSPAEILNAVQKINLGAFSITDHDTIDGNKTVIKSGIPVSVNFLSGVEISSYPPEPFSSSGSFHILGYGIDIEDEPLNQSLLKFQKARNDRNPKIISKLNNLGIDISIEEVAAKAGAGLIGRPHIAKLLIEKGYAATVKEAFNKYLARGGAAFVDKYRIDCENAIKLIRNAGGIPVLAHPVTLGMEFPQTEILLKKMVEFGLLGIEAIYTTHSPEDTQKYCLLADKLGLLITGGSDFHGSFKDNVEIGTGNGNLNIPYHLYEKLITVLNR